MIKKTKKRQQIQIQGPQREMPAREGNCTFKLLYDLCPPLTDAGIDSLTCHPLPELVRSWKIC